MIERDISWMYFNHRILQEARRSTVPLLERLSFLGIYSNNLDEFFRVRVASLNRIAESSDKVVSKSDSQRALKTIKQINKLNTLYSKEMEQITEEITRELEKENICILGEKDLTDDQLSYVRNFFHDNILGTTFPVWLSEIKQLSKENDDTIFLAIEMHKWNSDKKNPICSHAVMPLPVKRFGRFLRLPDADGKSYLMYLDDVMRCCLPMVFEGMEFHNFKAYTFKFTKDAEMEFDDDIDTGKMQRVQKGLKSRKRGETLRFIYDETMPKSLLRKVLSKLNLDDLDTIVKGGRYQNHKDFMSFPDCGRSDLKYPKWKPLNKPEFSGTESVLDVIAEKDRFIHVPYHSFDAYLRVLREAAVNPKVKSIKTTIYRLAKQSQVVEALIAASKNQKKVTVVIELYARFDEANNISWSKKMQDAGIDVIFGVDGLKVHSKITLIELSNYSIACIGTGNFHEGNARVYTDCLLFTASPTLVRDVAKVFEFIRSPFRPVRFRELLVSPNDMRNHIVKLINNEITNKKLGKPAYIMMKINHIVDEAIIRKLYAASAAGVRIDILLRGNCSLVTGVPGVSDNIHVVGIIDRYLEHSRILIFANGGNEKYYMGSADWMTRNLDRRIEVMTPVYSPKIQRELKLIVEYGLKDTVQGRIVDGTGDNIIQPVPEGEEPFRSQENLYRYYDEAIKAKLAKKALKEAKNKCSSETATTDDKNAETVVEEKGEPVKVDKSALPAPKMSIGGVPAETKKSRNKSDDKKESKS